MSNLNNDFDYSKTYYKVLRKDMTHRGFKYEMGLNIDTNEFDSNPKFTCVKGGLYFTDFPKIINFIDYGEYLAEIIIPKDAKVVILGGKYRTNKFNITNIKKLHDISTVKEIIERYKKKDFALEECITNLLICGNFDLASKISQEYKHLLVYETPGKKFKYINGYDLRRLFRISIKNKQKVMDFVINELDWYKYFNKGYNSNDYEFMKSLRNQQDYDTINFIYDNNL